MKAKDYFEKYRKQLLEVEGGRVVALPGSADRVLRLPKTDEEIQKILQDLYLELRDELTGLLDKRKVQTDKGFAAALGEINDKYNAIIGLFEKEYGWAPVKRNGFRDTVMAVIQESEEKKAPRLQESEAQG